MRIYRLAFHKNVLIGQFFKQSATAVQYENMINEVKQQFHPDELQHVFF